MANFLKSLFVKGVEIDTASATTGKVLTYDGTKFAPATPGAGSLAINDLSDVVITTPEEFQGLSYNGTNWINSYPPVVTYVRNAEATTLTTGTCVYLFGATGDHASVKRADNNSDTTSSKTIGVVGASITSSNNGPIVTRGYVDGINLSVGYTAGDVLWLGEAGAFTTTKPTAPDHLVFIGVVVRATNNGIIYVATQNGYELDELHNVSLPSPNSGDFLKYNGSLWVADAIDLGTDTTGNYMSGVSVQNGLTVSHTPGEGSSATIGVDNALLGNFLLEGASGNSYGLIGTSAYLDVKNTNGYNKEIELDIAAVKTQLNTDGYITETSASTLTNKTLTSPVITGAIFNDGSIVFEGATANTSETTLSVTDPTADRTITLPDATGTVALLGTIDLGTDTTGNYMSGISGTSPVSVSHTPAEGSSATVALASGYGDTQNPYASKTANYFLASPNGSAGTPTFRAIVAADIPTLNQNTTGNAATVTTNANLTGDVTSVGNATTIGANKVTRSMLATTEQMPVGTILMWAGGSTTTATYTNSDVPTGFLLCDGQEVARTGTYANLFTTIDIRYGQGDGSTTFNLPNLIAFAPVGAKTASAKTNGIRGTANAVATSYTTTGATSTTAHHSHTLTGSNSTASNIAISGTNTGGSNIGLTGSNTGGSSLYLNGANSNLASPEHSHTYQKPNANYFQTTTGNTYAVSGANSNIGLGGSNAGASNIALSGSNAAASNIGLTGSNAAASNFSAATLTTGNTTAHSHTISGHTVVYIIKF